MAFDVSKFEIADSAVMVVKNERGDEILIDGENVTIEFYSPGSKEGVRALRKAGKGAQMRLYRSMRGDMDQNDAMAAEQEHAQKLADFTKKISENFPIEPLALYSNPKLGYIATQAGEFISKYGNFPAGSSPN